jgi:hypothetical protein
VGVKKPSIRAITRIYATYRRNSRHKNILFALTLEQLYRLVMQDCFYCGAKPARVIYGHPSTKTPTSRHWVNGVDRFFNFQGYKTGNVVPCCTTCNSMKSRMNGGDFLCQIKKIARNLSGLRPQELKPPSSIEGMALRSEYQEKILQLLRACKSNLAVEHVTASCPKTGTFTSTSKKMKQLKRYCMK